MGEGWFNTNANNIPLPCFDFASLYKGRQGNRVYGYYTLLLISAINAVNVRYDLIALFGLLLWNKSISSAYRVADKDILEASNPRPP